MSTWDATFAAVVLPQLASRRVMPSVHPEASISPEAIRTFADTLLAGDPDAISRYLEARLADGLWLDRLGREVCEPTARLLGDMWQEDETSEWAITLGLSQLQLALRRLSQRERVVRSERCTDAVLVTPHPGEMHCVCATLSSELYRHDGWDVSSEPCTDEALTEILHGAWFDVLELSLSTAFRRHHRLPDLTASILTARAASRNPALLVLVGGREFFDNPGAYAAVGADAGYTSAADAVRIAHRLLNRLRAQNPVRAHAAGASTAWPPRDPPSHAP